MSLPQVALEVKPHDRQLRWLLGLPLDIAAVIKHGDMGGTFEIILTDGATIHLGTARKLISLPAARAAFVDAGFVLREMDGERWRDIVVRELLNQVEITEDEPE